MKKSITIVAVATLLAGVMLASAQVTTGTTSPRKVMHKKSVKKMAHVPKVSTLSDSAKSVTASTTDTKNEAVRQGHTGASVGKVNHKASNMKKRAKTVSASSTSNQ
jgi:hypothetical protein